jgi:hypothetical protein
MADLGYNPAVSLGVNAPDPNQGLNSLSKIMGLGQQGLSIQEQKQAIAGNQMKLQQQGIETQAAQDSTNFFKNWNPGEHHDETGVLDIGSAHASPAYQSLSGAGRLAVDTQMNALQGQQLTNKKALLGVNQDVVAQLGKVTQAASQSPKDGPALLDAFAKQGPDNARAAAIYVPLLQRANWNADALKTVAAQAQDIAGQQAQTNPQTQTVDTGGQILQQVVPKATGKPQTVGVLGKSTAPALSTNATGQTTVIAPGGKGVSVVPGANPTEAQATGQTIQAKAVGERVAQVQGQAANTVQAQDALSRAKAILESPEAPNTGAGFDQKKQLKNALSNLGIDTAGADDMNTLTKNLARYEASRATAAGLGGTDAARELAHNGSPNTQLDNKALQGIVRQSLATEKVLAGYANVQSKTNDPQQQLKNETAFRSIPHPIETVEYMMSRNKAEADAYLKSHGLKHEDVAGSAAALKQFGAL